MIVAPVPLFAMGFAIPIRKPLPADASQVGAA
jgi:hypothetical protein